MAEELTIAEGSKEAKYQALIPQIQSVISGEDDIIAKMANISSMIHHTFQFWWTGFYRVINDSLVLGPFQGTLACIRIPKGKGVCGTAWKQETTIIVPDVDLFPGHIACSSLSRSEIVVPVICNAQVIAVLDIDSQSLSTFDAIDKIYLEQIVALL